MTAEERREKARLRSERRRRAHGIGPRRPAQRPWLEAGCSRSTLWYRRKAKARQEAALAIETNRRRLLFERAEAFVAELQRDLAEAARCHAIAVGIIGEMAACGCWAPEPRTIPHPASSGRIMT